MQMSVSPGRPDNPGGDHLTIEFLNDIFSAHEILSRIHHNVSFIRLLSSILLQMPGTVDPLVGRFKQDSRVKVLIYANY